MREGVEMRCYWVRGAAERRVRTVRDATDALCEAAALRHTSAHALNEASSRSHCVISLERRVRRELHRLERTGVDEWRYRVQARPGVKTNLTFSLALLRRFSFWRVTPLRACLHALSCSLPCSLSRSLSRPLQFSLALSLALSCFALGGSSSEPSGPQKRCASVAHQGAFPLVCLFCLRRNEPRNIRLLTRASPRIRAPSPPVACSRKRAKRS